MLTNTESATLAHRICVGHCHLSMLDLHEEKEERVERLCPHTHCHLRSLKPIHECFSPLHAVKYQWTIHAFGSYKNCVCKVTKWITSIMPCTESPSSSHPIWRESEITQVANCPKTIKQTANKTMRVTQDYSGANTSATAHRCVQDRDRLVSCAGTSHLSCGSNVTHPLTTNSTRGTERSQSPQYSWWIYPPPNF